MYRGLAVVLGGILVSILVLAGCGSSDSETVTKAEFVKQSNAICEEAEERKEAAFRLAEKTLENGEVGQGQAQDLILNAALPVIRQMSQELGGLEAPEGDEDRVSEIVASFESAVKKAEENRNLDASRVEFLKASKLAEEYGLSSCTEF